MPNLRIEFPGSLGVPLAARLDLPDGPPRAFALFAHCFTCSKDSRAPAHIGKTLVEQGIALLRFDFTGLGGSEGEFENTNFSSNITDLVAAADWLRREYAAPVASHRPFAWAVPRCWRRQAEFGSRVQS